MTTLQQEDPIFYPKDVKKLLNIKHTNTLRLRIRDGRVPPPDVRVTLHIRYWYRATLVKAGLLPPASQAALANLQSPATSPAARA